MNRALFITIGIVIILITIAVWVFLLIKGKPDSTQDVFSNLGIIPETERPVVVFPEGEENTDRVVLSLDDNRLQQLTTNPVAGFGVATSGQAVIIRYVELGTGHIYDINLSSGLQTTVVPNTTANTVAAQLSPDLSHAMITTEANSDRSVTLLTIPRNEEGEVAKTSLPGDAENITFINNTLLRFTRNNFQNTIAYTYNIETNEVVSQTTLRVPDAIVVYDGEESVYAYPKPTKEFTGALYRINGHTILPISDLMTGFVPIIDNGPIAYTEIDDDIFQTRLQPSNQSQDIVMFPEKCVGDGIAYVWCGAPSTKLKADYLEDWYKGKISSDDTIWTIDTFSGSTTELASPKALTGRQIDLIHPQIDPTQSYLTFNNKIDQTLWLFSF